MGGPLGRKKPDCICIQKPKVTNFVPLTIAVRYARCKATEARAFQIDSYVCVFQIVSSQKSSLSTQCLMFIQMSNFIEEKKRNTVFASASRGNMWGSNLVSGGWWQFGELFFRGCGKEFNLTLTALPSPSFIVVVVVFFTYVFFPKMFISFEWRRLTAASFITLCVRTRFYICVI